MKRVPIFSQLTVRPVSTAMVWTASIVPSATIKLMRANQAVYGVQTASQLIALDH